MSDFDVWWEKQGVWPSEYTAACSAWQAAQAAERERAKGLVEALKYARRFLKKELHDIEFVDAAIAKYEGEK